MGNQLPPPPMATAAGVVSGLFDHIAKYGSALYSARTYLPVLQDANLQGMDNVRKLLTGVSYAAGSTTPELAGVSLAFAKLGGLLLVDAAQKKGVEQQKAVGTALTYTLLADWAQPRTLNRETLPEHDSIIQGTYDALQMMSGDRMKGTIACCRSAAKYSMPPRQDNQAVYHDQLLAHANQALDAIPTAKRLSRPAAE